MEVASHWGLEGHDPKKILRIDVWKVVWLISNSFALKQIFKKAQRSLLG
jgi:hypothetical protein